MEWDVYDPLLRYLHVLAGIVWIGHLYFFNLTNLPLLKVQLTKPFTADMAEKATANITVKALFWFRWGAMATLVLGLLLLEARRKQLDEVGLSLGDYLMDSAGGNLLLLGILLGIVMWFNVWFIIWPNQQKILVNNKKIAGGVTDDDKKRLAAENAPLVKNAVLASRFNTWASLPMLFGMVMGPHASGFEWGELTVPIVGLLAVVALAVVFSVMKPKATAAK